MLCHGLELLERVEGKLEGFLPATFGFQGLNQYIRAQQRRTKLFAQSKGLLKRSCLGATRRTAGPAGGLEWAWWAGLRRIGRRFGCLGGGHRG